MTKTAVKLAGESRDEPSKRLNYAPQGNTLAEFHRRQEMFVRTLIGPLGSAKTHACIVEVLRHIHNQVPDRHGIRASRVAVVRNTQPDLGTSTIPDWREITDALDIGEFKNGSPPSWTCSYHRADGTQVQGHVIFRSLDQPGDEKKARGMQLSGLWVNEAKEMNKTNVDMLMGRVGRYPPKHRVRKSNNVIIMDCNAPNRDEWMGRLALEEKPKGWWFGIQPPGVLKQGGDWITNPAAENLNNLPVNYYAKLVAGRADTWVRKNLANEFVFHTDQRPVHPDFSSSVHVGEVNPTPGINLVVGIDFGRTPAACVLQKQTNGQWYAINELCTVNMGADRFGQLLYNFMNEYYDGYQVEFIGDPAGDQMAQTRDETPFDLLAAANIDAWPAPTNDPLERYAALDGLLRQLIEGQPAFMVDPRCKTLVRGLSGAYYFRRVAVANDERYKDKAEKTAESHVCEACHYGLMGGGEGFAVFDQDTTTTEGDWTMPAQYFE